MDSQLDSCFEIRKERTEAEHLFHPVETKGGRKFRFQYQAWQVGPFWSLLTRHDPDRFVSNRVKLEMNMLSDKRFVCKCLRERTGGCLIDLWLEFQNGVRNKQIILKQIEREKYV